MRNKIRSFVAWSWHKLASLAGWLGEKVFAGAEWLWYKLRREQRQLYTKRIADIMEKVGIGCLFFGYVQGYDFAAPFAFPMLIMSVFLSGRTK